MVFSTIARWLFILCLPLLLLTGSITLAVNSSWLYKYGFDKYDISLTTGLEPAELEIIATELTGYFNSDDEFVSLTVGKDGELFNWREVSHLKDVKGLIHLGYRLLAGTLVYALGYSASVLFVKKPGYRRRLSRATAVGSGITLTLMLALGLGTLLGFDRLFRQFHIISFSNDFWLLDPGRDYLIMLFPQGFWYDATIFCALLTMAGAAVLGGVTWFYLKTTRPKT